MTHHTINLLLNAGVIAGLCIALYGAYSIAMTAHKKLLSKVSKPKPIIDDEVPF